MLTLRLSTYTPKEVDELKERISSLCTNLCSLKDAKSRLHDECDVCPYRNICYDFYRLLENLKLEQRYGYPNSKKSKR